MKNYIYIEFYKHVEGAEQGSKNPTSSGAEIRDKSTPPLSFRNKGRGDGKSGQERSKQNLIPIRPVVIPM